MELETVFRRHFARYPRMTPRDAVKLAYQSAFGPGHLIADRQAALARLEAELAETPPRPGPLLEDIGGGYARLELAPAKAAGLAPGVIFDRFAAAAAAPCPGEAAFAESLVLLESLAHRGEAPFSAPALAGFLTEYRAEGCPMVSHSETYRQLYRPAYRVVLASGLA